MFKRILGIAMLCTVALNAFAVDMTIDLQKKKVKITDTVAIRTTVPVTLINIGTSDPDYLVMRITGSTPQDASTLYAILDVFNLVVGDSTKATGNLNLNTSELVAYFEGLGPQTVRTFNLGLWDTQNNWLLINYDIDIQNNPYVDGMPGVSPAGTEFVKFVWSNDVWWAIGESNNVPQGMLPVADYSTNGFTHNSYLKYDTNTGFFVESDLNEGNFVTSGDGIQSGTNTITGTNTWVDFPTAYTGGAPHVFCHMTTNFTVLASPLAHDVVSTGFYFTVYDISGSIVTNAWPVEWISAPDSAMAANGYSDDRVRTVVSGSYGTIIDYDQGTNTDSQIPNWGDITNYVSGAGVTEVDPVWTAASNLYATTNWVSDNFATGTPLYVESYTGDVYTTTDNTYLGGTTQYLDALQATNSTLSIFGTNVIVNGTADSTNNWIFPDPLWSVTNGVFRYSSTTNTDFHKFVYDTEFTTQKQYELTFDITIVNDVGGAAVLVYAGSKTGDDGGGGGDYYTSGTKTTTIECGGPSTPYLKFYAWPVNGGTTIVTVDNITMTSLSDTVRATNGTIIVGEPDPSWGDTPRVTISHDEISFGAIGGAFSFDRTDILQWKNAVFTEVDPVFTAVSNQYAIAANETWQTIMDRGNTNSNDLVFSGTTQFIKRQTPTNSTIWIGGTAESAFGMIGKDNSSVTSFLDTVYFPGGPFAPIGYENSFTLGIPEKGYFVGSQSKLFGDILWYTDTEGTWNFNTNVLTNAHYYGWMHPTGTTTGDWAGTFAGTHTGDGSGLTNIANANFSGAWKIAYSDGNSDWQELALGTAGTFLKSLGMGTAPDWQVPTTEATNIDIGAITNVPPSTNAFILSSDGTNWNTSTLSNTIAVLGIGETTNQYLANIVDTATSNDIVYSTGGASAWTNGSLIAIWNAVMTALGGASGTGTDCDTVDGLEGTSFLTGSSNIGDLNNVDTTGVASNDYLRYNGTQWEDYDAQTDWRADDTIVSNAFVAADTVVSNAFVSADSSLSNTLNTADLLRVLKAGDFTQFTALGGTTGQVFKATGTGAGFWDTISASALSDLSDVDTTGVSSGEYLSYDGTGWTNSDAEADWQADDTIVSNGVTAAFIAADVVVNDNVTDAFILADAIVTANYQAADLLQPLKAGDLTQFTAVGGTTGQVFRSTGSATGIWGDQDLANTEGAVGNLAYHDGTEWIALTNLHWDVTNSVLHFGNTTNHPGIQGLGTTNMQFNIGTNTYIFPE